MELEFTALYVPVKYRPGNTHGNVDALSRREEREDDPKRSITASSRERGKEM